MSKKVVIYSSDSCGYCQSAKAYLKSKNISFTEKKVDIDQSARMELAKYNAKGVPLILVDNHVIRGFNKQLLDDLLKSPIIECPKCRSKLSVPENKGIIKVTCPKCNTKFKVDSNKL